MLVFSDTRPAWSIAFPTRRQVLLAAELTRAEARAYDQFVATAPSGHYTQTRAWARIAAAEGAVAPLFFLVRQGREVIGAGLVLRSALAGVPLPSARIDHGPVTAHPGDLPEVLAALRQSCLAKGIVRLSVAPYWSDPDRLEAEALLVNAGFTPRPPANARLRRSERLDLTALNDKRSWSARYLADIRQEIGRAVRAGASVRPGRWEDLAALRTLADLSPAAVKALGGCFLRPSAAMYVSEFEGALVSAIFVLQHKGLATTARVYSTTQALPFSPTVLPVTEAVQWARRMGALAFEGREAARSSFSSPDPAVGYCRTEFLLVREYVRWF